jgi:hypothetical protein
MMTKESGRIEKETYLRGSDFPLCRFVNRIGLGHARKCLFELTRVRGEEQGDSLHLY